MNSALKQLSGPQKTQLQSYLDIVSLKEGDVLWGLGDIARAGYILEDALVEVVSPLGRLGPFGTATLIADVASSTQNIASDVAARVTRKGRAFRVEAHELSRFLEDNPGAQLLLLGTRVVS